MLNLYRCMYINLNLHLLSFRIIQLVHWTVHFIGFLLHLSSFLESAWLDLIYLTGWQPKQVAIKKFLGRTQFAVPLLRSPDFLSQKLYAASVQFRFTSKMFQARSHQRRHNFQINTLPPKTNLWFYMNLRGFAFFLWPCTSVVFGKGGPHSPHDPVTASDSFALNGSLAPVPRLLQAGRPSEFITFWW